MAWSKEQEARLVELVKDGWDTEVIADTLGVTFYAVKSKLQRMRAKESVEAALNTPLIAPSHTVDVTADYPDYEGPRVTGGYEPHKATWQDAERINAESIEKELTRHSMAVNYPMNQPIGISFMADQHITVGSAVDLRQMRFDADVVRRTPNMYACLVGDSVDNHIKHTSAILHQKVTPGRQYEMFEEYLGFFGHKILALITGNHDDWTSDIAGIDMIAKLAAQKRIYCAPDELRMDVTVGGQLYRVDYRHQYRYKSGQNHTHSVKQWYRNGGRTWDIGVIAHEHEADLEEFMSHGQKCWAARPGSYQITSTYARRHGYNNATPSCPTFILFPGFRRIIGFSSVVDASDHLKYLLEKGWKHVRPNEAA